MSSSMAKMRSQVSAFRKELKLIKENELRPLQRKVMLLEKRVKAKEQDIKRLKSLFPEYAITRDKEGHWHARYKETTFDDLS